MAVDQTLNGLRNRVITSMYGRRLGLDQTDVIVGPAALASPIDGFSSAGSTVTSTSVASNLPAYGVSVVGATGASATTAYNLAAPIPGVRKTIFNPTTGAVTVLTSGAGALICSTGSAASTYGSLSFVGKGAYADLIGLSTALWGLCENLAITTVTTGNLVQLV